MLRLPRLVLVVAALLAIVSAPTFAVSADPTIGSHRGNMGAHTLVDTSNYPGASCKYDSGSTLRSFSVRPPIVYAFDRTAGTDTEWVAWRAVVEGAPPPTEGSSYVNWPDVVKSPWTKVQATDRHNARWSRIKVKLPAGPAAYPAYRVSIVMRWFHPGSSTEDGRAVHVVANYALIGVGGPRATLQCPESQVVTAAGVGTADSGTLGVHELFDSSEFTGVTCTFHNFDPRDDVKRITVRPPIVYATDRPARTDTQRVGWRFRVQATDVGIPTPADWFTVYAAPIVTVSATDTYNAQWKARSFAIANGAAHANWRAVVDMYWYDPSSGARIGKVTEYPVWYEISYGSGHNLSGIQGCGDTLG